MRRLLTSFAILITVAVAALYVGQRSLIFPAPNDAFELALESDVELIELESGRAFLALPLDHTGPAPLLVFAHGNAELAHWSIDAFRPFRKFGLAVLLLEYPGYGGAPGRTSSASMIQSAVMAVDRVIQRDDIDGDRMVVFGRSIGGGVASQLAVLRNANALVLQSPFSSLKALVWDMGIPPTLLKDSFDNAAALSRLDIPVLLYHGTQDRIVPIEHSERLEALSKDAHLITEKCGHNDCPPPWTHMLEFLTSIGEFDSRM